MSNFSNFVWSNAATERIVAGQIGLKTRIRLQISDAVRDSVKFGDFDPVKERAPDSLLGKELVSLDSKDPIVPRQAAHVLSYGTCYGPAGNWKISGAKHSVYGMNPTVLNEQGDYNTVALKQLIRNLCPNVEIKEGRQTFIVERLISCASYDNATTLLVALLQRLHKCTLTERSELEDYSFIIGSDFIAGLRDRTEEEVGPALVEAFAEHGRGISISLNDDEVKHWVTDTTEWLSHLPPTTVVDANGNTTVNPALNKSFRTFNCKVYKSHSYDDGASKSSRRFMSECGFIAGRMKVPADVTATRAFDERVTRNKVYFKDSDDKIIANTLESSGHINISSLTSLEVLLLDDILHGNKRTTPFLVDQNLDLGLGTKKINLYNGENFMLGEVSAIDSGTVKSLISKLVVSHQWYEELRNAQKALDTWLFQPSTETVESHWWVTTLRKMFLPRLGLSRAAIPGLVSHQGAHLNKSSIRAYKDLNASDDRLWVRSLFTNTCWFWGEYMSIHNASSTLEVYRNLMQGTGAKLQEDVRVDALVSAVTGESVEQFTTGQMTTSIQGGILSQAKRIVKFGKIDTTSMEGWGYTVSDKSVILNTICQPGCVGLIVGLAGPLLRDTPYGSIFQIQPAMMVRDGLKRRTAYDWSNLWAYCVVARWQGYDIKYRAPGSDRTLISYSANKVGIAMPPTSLRLAASVGNYHVLGSRERNETYGSDIHDRHEYVRTFCWVREKSRLQEAAEEWAVDAAYSEDMIASFCDMIQTDSGTTLQSAYIIAHYDLRMSGFRVDDSRLGVPLLDRVKELTSAIPPEPEVGDVLIDEP